MPTYLVYGAFEQPGYVRVDAPDEAAALERARDPSMWLEQTVAEMSGFSPASAEPLDDTEGLEEAA